MHEGYSPEPEFHEMLSGPPAPPELYPARNAGKLDVENYPDRETAELIKKEASDDLGLYNLLMLRAQLTMDRARNVIAHTTFVSDYSRLNDAIMDYNFSRLEHSIGSTAPPLATGRNRDKVI
jgi:hypothetical protein